MKAFIIAKEPGDNERLRAYCTALEWTVYDQFQSVELAIQSARKFKANGVIVARQMVSFGQVGDALAFLKRIEAQNNQVVLLEERIDTTTPAGEAFWGTLPMLESLAGAKRRRGERGPDKKPRKKPKRPRLAKFGFRWLQGERVEDPDEQAIIQRMKDLRASGETWRGICRILDAEGVERRGAKWKNRHGEVKELVEQSQ